MSLVTFPEKTPWFVTITKKSTVRTMVTARSEKEAVERAEKMVEAGECIETKFVSEAERALQLPDLEMPKGLQQREARVFEGAPDRDIGDVFRENLSRWMRLNEYNTNSLAKKTGIPQKTIWTLVSKKSTVNSPSIQTVKRLCDALNLDLEEMLR